MTFLELFRRYITYHEKAANKLDKRSAPTIRIYRNRYSIVNEFLHDRETKHLTAYNFDIPIAREYFEFLSARYKHNYTVRLVEMCSLVLHFGVLNKLIKYNPLHEYKIKRLAPERPLYLTDTELLALMEYQPKSLLKQKARDMFLFQSFTGMDYGDTCTVSQLHIVRHKGRSYIIKKRNKTGIEAIIPYHPVAQKIFEQNGYNLRLLCNAVYNRYLKEIAVDLGIDKHITTHTGRKTYAMIKLNFEGYSLEGVSKMIGHKSVSTTEQYYAQVEIELISRELDRLGQ